jgi:prepilin-type processing-associated H-X9-DG protein/prepilin-type N-terminal cleavage/methylation domain-containing protein
MKATSRTAFTLTELIVVIAIMSTLAALLLPALARAKKKGQRISCVNSVKQWNFAMIFFLDDNEEFLPRENAVDGINTWDDAIVSTNGDIWYNTLATEMGTEPLSSYAAMSANQMKFYDRNSGFHCPTAKFSGLAATYPNFSIAMNSKLITPGVLTIKGSTIREPSRTAFFLDSGVPGETPIQGQNPYNGQPHAYASRYSARHDGTGNIAMADGHIETLRADRVVGLDSSRGAPYGPSIFPPVDVVWMADPTSNPNR